MSDTIGKISGRLLEDNLLRDDVDLAFDSDLLYLNVTAPRLGINTDAPTRPLTVVGTLKTPSLIIDNGLLYVADKYKFSGNTIEALSGDINLLATGTNPTTVANQIETDGIRIDGNKISSIRSNEDIELTASGSGRVKINSNIFVDGALHSTGNVTMDGSIVFGSDDTDSVTFSADVNSGITPDVDLTYSLGTASKRFSSIDSALFNGTNFNTGELGVGGINFGSSQGNIYYVATNGDDGNLGVHQNDPLSSIGRALDLATSGDTVFIYPGVYQETLPLVVPQGVTVKGSGIRSVEIKPDSNTAENIFVLNGETTVEDLTISGFTYDAINDKGYAFSFAPNFTVTSRSPYIRNISVITKGSVTSVSDPLGFLEGDAGRGALIDGSIVNASSIEASMLFHSATFITPGADCIVMKNGVRVEWLNSFIYYANVGLLAESTATGFAGDGKTRLKIYGLSSNTVVAGDTITLKDGVTTIQSATIESITYDAPYANIVIDGLVASWVTSDPPPDSEVQQEIEFSGGETATHIVNADYLDFGAEVRSIGSANVYGNYGARADGDGTIMYLVNHNFGYIGSGKDSNNDPSVAVEAQQADQINNGRIYFQSMDQDGNFRVGEIFKVIGETGDIFFNSASFVGSTSFITSDGLGNTTTIDSSSVTTGNISITDNSILSLSGSINFNASNDQINITSDTTMGGLDIIGNINAPQNTTFGNNSADNIAFNTQIQDTLIPKTTSTYSLGNTDNAWNDFYVAQLIVDDITVDTNVITTTLSNSDLELAANGSGQVRISDNFTVNQNYTNNTNVDLMSILLKNIILAGNINLTGNFSTNDFINITGTISTTSTANFNDIRIDENNLETTTADTDLILKAQGSGDILIPTNDVSIARDLNVIGDITVQGGVGSTGTYTTDQLDTGSLIIDDNYIATYVSNADLELRANAGGVINVQDSATLEQDATVNGTAYLKNTEITGTLTHVGNNIQLGIFNNTGNVTISDVLATTNITNINEVKITDNYITTNTTNTDLELRASGTGKIVVPTNDLLIPLNLIVTGNTFTTGNVSITGTLTSARFIGENIEIKDNYITTTLSNSDLELRTSGTGSIWFEDTLALNGASFTNILSPSYSEAERSVDLDAGGSIKINSTKSIKIPVGNNTNRTLTVPGEVRLNNSYNMFEGYHNSALKSLYGIYDSDRNTYISAESTIGANDNVIRFYINGSLHTTLDKLALTTPQMQIDNVRINNREIATIASNEDIQLDANGTGKILIKNNISIVNNIITNETTNANTVITTSGTGGYIEFSDETALRIPAGTDIQRPAPVIGHTRWSISNQYLEVYDGTTWSIATGGGETVTGAFMEELTAELTLIFG